MKKIIAMLLAMMLVLSFAMVPAMAEAVAIGETNLTLDLGDLEEYELEDEDLEEGIIMVVGNEEETLEIVVMAYDAEGATLEDVQASMAEDTESGITGSGTTTINGVDAFFMTITDGEDNYIVYFVLDGEIMLEITVWYADDAAGALSSEVMNTLALAK